MTGNVTDRTAEMVAMASRNTERLIRLVNDILDFEKIEAGHFELDLRPVAPNTLLTRAVVGILTLADEAGVKVDIETSELPEVLADAHRLVQVLTNLLSNAVKFSGEGARVVVRGELSDDVVRLAVSDQGPGITREDVPKLFERFRQLDPSDARDKGGSGLGLPNPC